MSQIYHVTYATYAADYKARDSSEAWAFFCDDHAKLIGRSPGAKEGRVDGKRVGYEDDLRLKEQQAVDKAKSAAALGEHAERRATHAKSLKTESERLAGQAKTMKAQYAKDKA